MADMPQFPEPELAVLWRVSSDTMRALRRAPVAPLVPSGMSKRPKSSYYYFFPAIDAFLAHEGRTIAPNGPLPTAAELYAHRHAPQFILTTEEAGGKLGVSADTVRRRITTEGTLGAFWLSQHCIRIPVMEITRYLALVNDPEVVSLSDAMRALCITSGELTAHLQTGALEEVARPDSGPAKFVSRGSLLALLAAQLHGPTDPEEWFRWFVSEGETWLHPHDLRVGTDLTDHATYALLSSETVACLRTAGRHWRIPKRLASLFPPAHEPLGAQAIADVFCVSEQRARVWLRNERLCGVSQSQQPHLCPTWECAESYAERRGLPGNKVVQSWLRRRALKRDLVACSEMAETLPWLGATFLEHYAAHGAAQGVWLPGENDYELFITEETLNAAARYHDYHTTAAWRRLPSL